MDVAIVDCLWNGVGESVKIAALCDLFEVNCAAHNYRASPAPTCRRPDSAALLCAALRSLPFSFSDFSRVCALSLLA